MGYHEYTEFGNASITKNQHENKLNDAQQQLTFVDGSNLYISHDINVFEEGVLNEAPH